jgi:flavin-binding protein dodecin
MQYFSVTFELFEDEEWLAARSAAADRLFNPQTVKENTVSKSASTSSVYRVTELIGTSESSWEDAAKHAVETATKTLRDLRVAEVNKLDLVIVDGKVTAFRARVNLSFKYEKKD